MLEADHCISSAIVLGNPTRSPFGILPEWRPEFNDISIQGAQRNFGHSSARHHVSTIAIDDYDSEDRGEDGSTRFVYKEDPERFGTGNLVVVKYTWNDDEPRCVENDTLLHDYGLPITTLREIIGKVKILLPVTSFEIKTVNGSLMVSEIPNEITRPYPRIPNSLALIPRIPLASIHRNSLSVDMSPNVNIDIVARDGDSDETWYVFKRYRIPVDLERGSMDELLSEVVNQSNVDYQFVIKPSFLVTMNDDTEALVGYLMPFLPAGTLADVFSGLVADGPITREPMLSHPKFQRFLSSDEWDRQASLPAITSIHPIPNLAWNLKHTWAIEISTGLVSLHESGLYTGKLRFSHILLDRDGHLRLCSISPMKGFLSSDPYRAPEFDLLFRMHTWPSPTAATDVYALGVVLWQIAEEVAKIEHDSELNVTWRLDVPAATPQWYQSLVKRCLDSEPLNRPSAKDVLDVLVSHQ